MTHDFDIVNPIEDPQWDQRILDSFGGTIFHTSAWARIMCQTFGYEPFYLCRSAGKRLSACLPVVEVKSALFGRKGKTLPFTDYCDPLLSDGLKAEDMLDFVVEHGRSRGWKSYELRGGTDLHGVLPEFLTCYGHSIDLKDGSEKVFSTFRSSTKRNIKRAAKAVRVEHHHSLKAMKAYYRLHRITRKRQGLFIQPFRLFRGIYEQIIAKGLGFVSLALVDRQPVASAIYFCWNGRVEFAFGASDKRFQHLRPNNAIQWDCIQWGAQQGYDELSLGITDAENGGLRQYKKGLATTETKLHFYKYDYRKEELLTNRNSLINDLRIAVCKRMPTAALGLTGELLYRARG